MEKDGELTGSVLTFVDITERRIAEMRLRESEERTRLILNSTGEGIYGVDLQGNCTFANPACVRLLGFDSADELLGRNMHNLVHHSLPNGAPYAMEDCRIYQAFRVGEGVRVDDEVMWRRDGSSFPTEYWSYPMEKDGELTGSVLTFVDITERRHMEVRLRNERERAESLLLNVLPAVIAERLKNQPGSTLAERFEAVSVLFADLVGFTPLAARLNPEVSVDLLNDVFTAFDTMTMKHGVEKIKTIGDGYMVVGGAPEAIDDQCATMTRLALDMQSWMRERDERDGIGLKLRIGINCGPAVGAIIGTNKFQYDLWGDAVNVASRMESNGLPGRIQISEVVKDHLGTEFDLESRGEIAVKGRGRLSTWFVDSLAS
jgi:urea transport system substrate-binding protein